MSTLGRNKTLSIAGVPLVGAAAIALSIFFAGPNEAVIASPMLAQPLGYDLSVSAIADDQVVAAEPGAVAADPATLQMAVAVTPNDFDASGTRAAEAPAPVNDLELECIAKVVHHEAANQSRRGQLAVAQLIVNRAESGRFPATACGVVNQPGQFFQTASYNPSRSTPQWSAAVDVAREAMAGHAADVVPGAMFYHAAHQPPTRWFRTRTRVATLEDHIFYR